MNISDLILWVLYLLPEIIITLCCLIIISVHSKNIYFHLFNLQHILLSSGMNQNAILSIFKSGYLNFLLGGCPRGVMVKEMDCGIVVREFVLQSRYYVHFRVNTLGKGMNPLILPAIG